MINFYYLDGWLFVRQSPTVPNKALMLGRSIFPTIDSLLLKELVLCLSCWMLCGSTRLNDFTITPTHDIGSVEPIENRQFFLQIDHPSSHRNLISNLFNGCLCLVFSCCWQTSTSTILRNTGSFFEPTCNGRHLSLRLTRRP